MNIDCPICGAPAGRNVGIPMYEGVPVAHDYVGEWGGFDCCQQCFDDYNKVQHNPALLIEWFETRRTEPHLFFNPT
jgi:hypothetical protein